MGKTFSLDSYFLAYFTCYSKWAVFTFINLFFCGDSVFVNLVNLTFGCIVSSVDTSSAEHFVEVPGCGSLCVTTGSLSGNTGWSISLLDASRLLNLWISCFTEITKKWDVGAKPNQDSHIWCRQYMPKEASFTWLCYSLFECTFRDVIQYFWEICEESHNCFNTLLGFLICIKCSRLVRFREIQV